MKFSALFPSHEVWGDQLAAREMCRIQSDPAAALGAGSTALGKRFVLFVLF